MNAAPRGPADPTDRGGPVCIGIDLGTSSVKAVAVGPDGLAIASARRGYPTARPRPGVAEQDPESWWRGLDAVLGEIATAVPATRWRALGLTAMLPTLLLLDGAHRPVAPAITWQDDRGEADGARMRRRIGAQALYRRTGQWVDGRYLLPMAEALARRDPAAATRSRFLVGAKDYLFQGLTGELRTDPSTAAGYGCYDIAAGQWMPEMLGGWEVPALADAHSVAPLHAGAADRLGLPPALPVVLGAADSVLGALAVGALAPGSAGYLAGSSTVILGPLPAPHFDAAHRFLVTPTVLGGVAAEMDLLATGSAQGWLAGLVGPVDDVAPIGPAGGNGAAGAGDVTAGHRPDAPLFLPYLSPGEQGALWDPQLSGALLGLTLAHDRHDLARALLTGIVVESARCLEVLAQAVGTAGDVHAGGPAVSARAAQDLADATGRRVLLDDRRESQSARGAAILAAQATGDEAAAGFLPRRVLEPDPGRREWWEAAMRRHDSARLAIRAISDAGGAGPEP